MTSARGRFSLGVFSEKNEHNCHSNRQHAKVREGYNLAATVVDQISFFKVPLFVKPADNQVDHGSCAHEYETYIYETVN